MKCRFGWLAFSLVGFLTTGCTSVEFVRKDITPHKAGVFRYVPPTSADSETKYREQVTKKATEFCGGEFTITKEYQAREETGSSSGVGTGIGIGMGAIMIGGATRSTAMYNFVEFSCK